MGHLEMFWSGFSDPSRYEYMYMYPTLCHCLDTRAWTLPGSLVYPLISHTWTCKIEMHNIIMLFLLFIVELIGICMLGLTTVQDSCSGACTDPRVWDRKIGMA